MLDTAPRIRELRALIEAVRNGRNAEAVHAARVTASRLAAWLALGGARVLRDDLRWLRRAMAPARDLDVLLERSGTNAAFAAWLEVERAGEQPLLAARLEPDRCAALLRALERLRPPEPERARTALAALARRARHAGDACVEHEGTDEAAFERAHVLRRRLRRLRHALEWTETLCEPVRIAQGELGLLCDDALLARTIERARALGVPVALEVELEHALARGLRRAHERWPALRAHVAALAAVDEPVPMEDGR